MPITAAHGRIDEEKDAAEAVAVDERMVLLANEEGDLGNMISQASTTSNAELVARWRESSKCIAEMAKSGNLPADAAPQSHDRGAPNWDPSCNLQDSRRSIKEMKAAVRTPLTKRSDRITPSILTHIMRLRP